MKHIVDADCDVRLHGESLRVRKSALSDGLHGDMIRNIEGRLVSIGRVIAKRKR